MPTITVSVDDYRHSEHDSCVQFMDDSAICDWDDFADMYPPEEIEVSFDEWREHEGH
jgi:hypothetical protein